MRSEPVYREVVDADALVRTAERLHRAEAFAGADVVYPKSWGRIDAFRDERKALAESAAFRDWICDARRMSLAASDALCMHCLPADGGTEVTDEVIDGPQSVVYDETENRMHTARALMAPTMGGYPGREEVSA